MQAGTYFPGDEKNAALSCSFNLNTFLASFHAASAGTLTLATLSLRVNDPQILEHWGYAHEVHLDKCNRARILVSNFSMTYNSFGEFYTSDWFPYV